MIINWNQLSDAVAYYKGLGYTYVETPWYVESKTGMITCPSRHMMLQLEPDDHDAWTMVGSAEQGFLQRIIDGNLDKNKTYLSCGPCIRKEEIYDDLHLPQFMKVELFRHCKDIKEADAVATEFIDNAFSYMRGFCLNDESIEKTETDDPSCIDIEINGIEVGSYGTRYYESVGWWVYGTGLAEPRFSTALKYQHA